MRIVIDLQGAQTESRNRGIGRYSIALTQAIIRNAKEHEIFIVVNLQLPAINDIRLAFKDVLPPERIVAFDVPMKLSWEAPENSSRRKVAELIRENFLVDLNPDLILITSLFEGASNCDATHSIGTGSCQIPTAVILYDLIPLFNPDVHLGFAWVKNWYMDKIESLKRADLLLAISNYAKKEAIDLLGLNDKKITAISSAHTDIFFPASMDEKSKQELLLGFKITLPYVLYNGALESRKNLERLIQAFSLLPLELRNQYQLVFAGKGADVEQQKLLKLASKYGISDSLILTGYISDAELIALFSYCEVFVFPSVHEGFGLPALEAMACGAPTIGSCVTSIPEVIGREDALFDPLDPADIAEKIAKVLTDSAYRESLRQHALVHSATFSWDACAKAALAGFETIAVDCSSKIKQTWKEQVLHREKNYQNLISSITAITAPGFTLTETDLIVLANCIARNIQTAEKVARGSALPAPITWRIEGPFDSSYSLALLNRETARALVTLGHQVVLHSTDGPGDFAPNAHFLEQNSELAQLYYKEREILPFDADVSSRNLYPPRVADMHSRWNFLHHYAWEESGFPLRWVDDFNSYLQGLTCLSEHVRKIMLDHGVTVPLLVSGCGVDHWERITADKDYIVGGKSFRFLHVSSCFPRKGVKELLEAYGQAFTSADDVTLIIKTFANPHNKVDSWLAEAQQKNPNYPDVHLIMGDLTDAELKALYEQCQVLVAPSKAEGFGLPMAEAMLSNLPVITTAWGGQLDFCNAKTAWLVDYDFERAATHFNIFSSVWAKPKIDDLAKIMCVVYAAAPELRTQRAKKGRDLLLSKFRWDDVVKRLVALPASLAKIVNLPEPRVGWISTWNARCGIATYSDHLVKYFSLDTVIFANRTTDLVSADSHAVVRCWNAGEQDNLSLLDAQIDLHQIDTLVIQFNYYFFEFEHFSEFVNKQVKLGRQVVVMLHSTIDPIQHPQKALMNIKDALARCTRILVHAPADMNRLKQLGLINNVCLFPHGIIDYQPKLAADAVAIAKNKEFVIASYGFFLPHKGLLELITAVVSLRRQGCSLRLKMINAEYPHIDSTTLIQQAKEKIEQLEAGDFITLHTDFLTDLECLDLLNAADVLIYPYQETGESSSAAVRYGLASKKPVLVTPLPIFDDVNPAVTKLAGTTSEQIAEGIAEIMRHIQHRSPTIIEQEERAANWREEHLYPKVAQRLSRMLLSFYRM